MRKFLDIRKVDKLYLVDQLSTYQIAQILGVKPNTIRVNLRNRKKMRPQIGKDVEISVYNTLLKKGYACSLSKRGDAPFDLLVNGDKVDVKSASLMRISNNYYGWCFQLYDMKDKAVKKDIVKEVDWYCLVLKDVTGRPMYKVYSEEISARGNRIAIPQSRKSKYSSRFIGYLDSEPIPTHETLVCRNSLTL